MNQILIVDDDENNRAVLSDALCDEPYELHEAENGLKALEFAKSDHPDLILLDIMMPGMDGISVLRALRADASTRSIPVIVVSACGSESQVTVCLEEGAEDHISKPFSNRDVRERIQSALRSRKPAAKVYDFQEQTIGFVGAKGGVGTTTVALNTALMLQQDRQVTVLELHPSFGSFSPQLRMVPEANLSQLDLTFSLPIIIEHLEPLVHPHASGLQVLFGPQPADGFVNLNPRFSANLLLTLRRMADYTVIDFPSVPTPSTLAAMTHCDQIVLVVEPDASCLVEAAAMGQEIEQTCGRNKFSGCVVVRRSSTASSLALDEVQSALNCPILGEVQHDPDYRYPEVNPGEPIVLTDPEHVISRSFQQIVPALGSLQPTA